MVHMASLCLFQNVYYVLDMHGRCSIMIFLLIYPTTYSFELLSN